MRRALSGARIAAALQNFSVTPRVTETAYNYPPPEQQEPMA